jgi:RNase adapter protein RapZ
LATSIKSFGFRHGLVLNGHIVHPTTVGVGDSLIIDVRKVLPKNPYHNKKLRQLRGDDEAVIAELEQTPGIEQAYHELLQVVRQYIGPVYIGCTGGHHRSVYIANRLAKDLGLPVEHLNYDDK